jgi:exopolyphosphatase/guanosine-5'-triphosphate,3'-diphosphate pyrophosphatase
MLIYTIPVMPLFASIDVGSNTLRLLIAKRTGHQIIDVFTSRKITRLGNMVHQTGMLQPENVAASLRVLREFSAKMDHHGVTDCRAIATSALREAQNSDLFIRQVKEETGIRIEIISGEEEAKLTLSGILHAFSPAVTEGVSRPVRNVPRRDVTGVWQHSLFIMDIGGGSTEWILYQGEDRKIMGSLPSGVIKLAQRCISSDPVSAEDIERLNQEIRPVLEVLHAFIDNRIPEATLFVGTGGTFTTIASVDLGLDAYVRESIHLHRMLLTRLRTMQHRFLKLSVAERKKIQGLEPGRADLIIPGVQFTMNVMELFNFRELIVSDYGLLEGALLAMKEACAESIPETGES